MLAEKGASFPPWRALNCVCALCINPQHLSREIQNFPTPPKTKRSVRGIGWWTRYFIEFTESYFETTIINKMHDKIKTFTRSPQFKDIYSFKHHSELNNNKPQWCVVTLTRSPCHHISWNGYSSMTCLRLLSLKYWCRLTYYNKHYDNHLNILINTHAMTNKCALHNQHVPSFIC